MNYWIIKSEPFKYSFDQMKADKTTIWDGVRNYEARNNLRSMKEGDICFFYHSNEEKSIVGTVTVSKEHFPDPTIDDERWLAVEVKYKAKAKHPLALATVKMHSILSNMSLVRRSRLSVAPVSPAEAEIILQLLEGK